ncbi:hypothetical protein, partial [Nostoc sp. CHAB 5715]|uniref:hypothetical protein n=1 Tax=Nostoc sp. CHAB 5715 TaxID=2780400 RepID=UPI001E47D8F6
AAACCEILLNFTEEEFRIQEPESSMDSVRLDVQSRFKAPDFNRGEEKILSVIVTPDLIAGVF